jgi:hypothetical protein
MVLYPNKLPESERVCFGICNQYKGIECYMFNTFLIHNDIC